MLRTAAVGVSGVALLATSFVGGAQASPLDDAKAKVEKLTTEAAAIDQDYAAAVQKLDDSRKELKATKSDLSEQAEKVESMRTQVGQVALAQYQNRNVDTSAQLFFTSDSESFLSKIATVDKVSDQQNTVLQDFQTEQANLADLERSSEAQVAKIATTQKEKDELRKDSDTKVKEAKATLARLTEEERQRIAEEEAAEAAEAERAAEQAEARAASTNQTSRDSDRSSSSSESKSEPKEEKAPEAPPASGRAGAAVAFAKAQIGKPYSYGGTGPGAYDCSGLTGAAWKAAGVSLGRTSQAQFSGRQVSKGDLQPGDLVFYYGGITHVGMYVGGGQIVHASRPGKPIGYAGVDSMPYQGAVRPG